MKNLPYDPLKDFIPVAPLTSQPYVLVAGKLAGITTVSELIAAAKAKPGQLKVGSTGMGTGSHLGIEKFNLAARIKAVHVPARPGEGIADTIANTVAGRTDYLRRPSSSPWSNRRGQAVPARREYEEALVPTTGSTDHCRSRRGRLRLSDLVWRVDARRYSCRSGGQLAKDIARALAAPGLTGVDCEAWGYLMNMTQPEFAHFVLTESESAARVIEAAGIKPQ